MKRENEIQITEKQLPDDTIEFQGLGVELSQDQIIKPFVFVNADNDDLTNVLLDYTTVEPFMNVCKEIADINTIGSFHIQYASKKPINILSDLYTEYSVNMILTNILSIASSGFMNTIRKYTKDLNLINTKFQQEIIRDLNYQLAGTLRIDLDNFITTYIVKMINEEKPELKKYISKWDLDAADKSDSHVIPLNTICSMMNSSINIASRFAEFINGIIALDIIDYESLVKDRLKNHDERFEFGINDDPNIMRMAVHRYLSILVTEDINAIADIIDIVSHNTISKITEDINSHKRDFIYSLIADNVRKENMTPILRANIFGP